MNEELLKVVEEIEAEQELQRVAGIDVFSAMLNQPAVLAVSSADKEDIGPSVSFNEFTVRLPRTIRKASSLQLLNANIPQCVQNIPDTACVFWYYRLSAYSGLVPNTRNLYMVRLLPSYYKPEHIISPEKYGFNRTFTSYSDLATELGKACKNDLAYTNLTQYEIAGYDVPFLPNEISITYNSTLNKFQMTGTNATTQLCYKQYSNAVTYALGDTVFIGTATYISLQGGNLNNKPYSSPTWWKHIYIDIVAAWDADVTYQPGRYVRYGGVLYKCIATTQDNVPPNTDYWVVVIDTEYAVNYRYLITGPDDPNVRAKQGNQQYDTWNQYALFENESYVSWNDKFWMATTQSQNEEPGLAGPWSEVVSPPPFIVGVNQCSAAMDMLEDSVNTGLLYPFPEGIPGQPFNPVPRRLLNSVLGFTWNGQGPFALLSNIQVDDRIGYISSISTALYNRVRPVPAYITMVDFGYGAATSTASQTYTADGYCNLVYSSIINIYVTMIGGSTLNTNPARASGLLAMGSMNCGNLGVSFFSPYINNPLDLFISDLDTLAFRFEDEMGEPYVFTNNAVLTLVMKFTYDEKKLPIE